MQAGFEQPLARQLRDTPSVKTALSSPGRKAWSGKAMECPFMPLYLSVGLTYPDLNIIKINHDEKTICSHLAFSGYFRHCLCPKHAI
jgi:hypothetical protein